MSFIRIVTSLSFASKIELGYDPTVKRILAQENQDQNGGDTNKSLEGEHQELGQRIQYEFTVGDRTFVTTKTPLSDFRADFTEGRSTRVWRAYDKSDPLKAEVALKDIWMLSDAATEGELLCQIKGQLLPGEERYFLTVEVDGIVKVNEIDDTTHTTIMRGPPTILTYLSVQKSTHGAASIQPLILGSNQVHSIGHQPGMNFTSSNKRFSRRQFTSRKHYRIVFKEVCVPLHGLNCLDNIYALLMQATEGKSHRHSCHLFANFLLFTT
jgi:Fungal protein kinase